MTNEELIAELKHRVEFHAGKAARLHDEAEQHRGAAQLAEHLLAKLTAQTVQAEQVPPATQGE